MNDAECEVGVAGDDVVDDRAHPALQVRVGGLHDNGHVDILVGAVQGNSIGVDGVTALTGDGSRVPVAAGCTPLVAARDTYHDSAFPQKNAYSGELQRDRYTATATATRARSTIPTAAYARTGIVPRPMNRSSAAAR